MRIQSERCNALVQVIACWGVFAALLFLPQADAHDIPAEVRVQAWVKPAGERLQLLVRVPLRAMIDVDFPKRGPGYLDLARAEPALREAARLWIGDRFRVYENGVLLGPPALMHARVSLPSDRAFEHFGAALEHLRSPPLPTASDIYWTEGLLDVLLEYAIGAERSSFAVEPRFERLGVRTQTVLRYATPDGAVRAYDYHGNAGVVQLDPGWWDAAQRFVRAGIVHILSGADHLLFLLALVVPFRRAWPVIVVVTAFTVAHSLTLAAAALGWGPDALWFPPLVETLVAVSILYMAVENMLGANLGRRWALALVFGLVHGFAFAFELTRTLQFAGDHLLAALVAFNLGVEIGQVAVVIALVAVLRLLFGVVPERVGAIVISVFVAHSAWHWMVERGEQLSRFPLPQLDAAALAAGARWLMAIVAVAAALWLAALVKRLRAERRRKLP